MKIRTAAVPDVLSRIADGARVEADDVATLLGATGEDLELLTAAARARRDHNRASTGLDGVLTYSRKVFIPLTHMCRYRCSYCTFVKTRVEAGTEFLELEQVLEIAREGRAHGCTEALFTLGEGAEVRHPEAAAWLKARGYSTTAEYLHDAAEAVVVETGLLPHLNPGAVTLEEMERLREVSVSQGLMMEQTTDRLLRPGEAHAAAAGKAAAARLEQLTFAAKTRTPFTTGTLMGIGETLTERAQTLLDIANLCEDAVQEVIVQNFRAKPDTPMRDRPDLGNLEMVRAIATARMILPLQVSVQSPPNLADDDLGSWIDAGLDDFGGVSPVTLDHVNPERRWPELEKLEDAAEARGFALRGRLPAHPRFLADTEWLAPQMRRHALALSDAGGLAREERWYAGEGWTPVHRTAVAAPKRRALAININTPDQTAAEVSEAAFVDLPAGVGVTRHDHHPESGQKHPWLAPLRRQTDGMRLRDTLKRAGDGEALSRGEIQRLFTAEGADLGAVIDAADALRDQVNGDAVTYVVNRNITYTNVCQVGCGFCGFARPQGHGDAYAFSMDEIREKVAEAWSWGATEVCIQGGIDPRNDGNIYLEIARAVKDANPGMHLHGFSPLEVWIGASTLGLEVETYLDQLADAGLDTMPGTAAEILDHRIRPLITPQKLSRDDWLRVMRAAHERGIRSTVTIMFGHVDDPAAWAEHLTVVRELQAETGGFTEFVPLPFVHHRSPIFMRGASRCGPTWREAVKMHAVSRLALHGLIDNIQASWVKLGPDGVMAMLHAGVNDVGGTLGEEHISRMAGAAHGLRKAVDELTGLITKAGRRPVRRNTLYEHQT